jgi:hypothetical protein
MTPEPRPRRPRDNGGAIAQGDGQPPLSKTTSSLAAAVVLLVAACGIYVVIQLGSTHG